MKKYRTTNRKGKIIVAIKNEEKNKKIAYIIEIRHTT